VIIGETTEMYHIIFWQMYTMALSGKTLILLNTDILMTTQVKCASLLHYVLGEHEWLTGKCEHEALQVPPTDVDGKQNEYFDRYELAFKALQKIIMDKNWLKI